MVLPVARLLTKPVIRHRIVMNFAAQAEGYTPDRLVDDMLAHVKPHAGGLMADDRVNKTGNTGNRNNNNNKKNNNKKSNKCKQWTP